MIEHEQVFSSENPSKSFARYHTLSPSHSAQLRAQLFEKLRLPKKLSTQETMKLACQKSKLLIEQFQGSGLEIFEILASEVGYRPKLIFVNYKAFEQIYEIESSEFIAYFEYLYFPGPDDIEIFDANMNWLFQINHHEDLLILKA